MELARELSSYLQEVEFDPDRLEEVDERLNLIFTLKRKYGENIEAILAFGEQARQELDAITHAEERMQELESREEALLKVLAETGSGGLGAPSSGGGEDERRDRV